MVIGHGEIVKEYKTLKPSKQMCIGCHCDFYNGKNPYNIAECWNFKDAKVVNKKFYTDFNCTDDQRVTIEKTLDCYRG